MSQHLKVSPRYRSGSRHSHRSHHSHSPRGYTYGRSRSGSRHSHHSHGSRHSYKYPRPGSRHSRRSHSPRYYERRSNSPYRSSLKKSPRYNNDYTKMVTFSNRDNRYYEKYPKNVLSRSFDRTYKPRKAFQYQPFTFNTRHNNSRSKPFNYYASKYEPRSLKFDYEPRRSNYTHNWSLKDLANMSRE